MYFQFRDFPSAIQSMALASRRAGFAGLPAP